MDTTNICRTIRKGRCYIRQLRYGDTGNVHEHTATSKKSVPDCGVVALRALTICVCRVIESLNARSRCA